MQIVVPIPIHPQYMLNDVLCHCGVYTNWYSICACPICVLEHGASRNVTPVFNIDQFTKLRGYYLLRFLILTVSPVLVQQKHTVSSYSYLSKEEEISFKLNKDEVI